MCILLIMVEGRGPPPGDVSEVGRKGVAALRMESTNFSLPTSAILDTDWVELRLIKSEMSPCTEQTPSPASYSWQTSRWTWSSLVLQSMGLNAPYPTLGRYFFLGILDSGWSEELLCAGKGKTVLDLSQSFQVYHHPSQKKKKIQRDEQWSKNKFEGTEEGKGEDKKGRE